MQVVSPRSALQLPKKSTSHDRRVHIRGEIPPIRDQQRHTHLRLRQRLRPHQQINHRLRRQPRHRSGPNMLNPESPLPQHQAHPSTSTLEPSRPIQLIRNNDHLIGHEFILRSPTRHDLIFSKATCDRKDRRARGAFDQDRGPSRNLRLKHPIGILVSAGMSKSTARRQATTPKPSRCATKSRAAGHSKWNSIPDSKSNLERHHCTRQSRAVANGRTRLLTREHPQITSANDTKHEVII